MKIGRRNKVSTDILSFNIGLIGESGCGKTTTIYKMLEKLCPNGYLFAECGMESGEEALENINAVKVIDWNSDYDEDHNTVGFRTLVDEVVDNKSTDDWKDLRVIVWDTIDELSVLAKNEVIRMHNKQHPDKKTNTIKACFGGYMAGEDMANQLILDAFWDLKRVGVSFIIIGHTKQREQTDSVTGETYTQLTTNMALRDFNAIKTKLHFLGVAYIDRNIVREKAKTGSKKTVGKITGDERKIVFRSDDFSIDSKSRFADIIPEIPLDADEFIKALQDAINREIEKNGVAVNDRKNEVDKMAEKRKEEVSIAEQKMKKERELNAAIKAIKEYCKENKGDKTKLLSISQKAKELGYENPVSVATIEDANAILALCV